MAFPESVLGTKVELFYDGAWHNITSDENGNSVVRGIGAEDGDISISARGEPDEETGLVPTQATLSVNNRNGRFSPRNAQSDLYGKIGFNTPIRVATDLVDTTSIVDNFTGTRTNTWGVTDESGHTWVNTTSGSTDNFDVSGGVGIHTHNANTTPCFSSINSTVDGADLTITDFDVVVSGITPSAAAAGDNIEVGIWGRRDGSSFVEARLLFNPGNQVLVAVREIINNVETGNTGFVVISGASSTDVMSFRFEAIGHTIRMRAWETANTEPSTWDRELAVTHVTPGALTLFSTLHAGNANSKPFTVTYDSFNASLGVVLFTGEVIEWPKRWDSTGNDVWVPLVAAGITRRLRQGNRPIRSPLYRYYTRDLADENLGTVTTTINHYWPLEDLAQQTRFIRDEIDGESILSFDVATHNTVEWGSNDFVVGSGKLVTITGLPIPEGVVVVPFISDFRAPFTGLFDAPDVEDADTFTFSCWFYCPPLLEDFPFLPATSLYFSFRVADSPLGNIFVDIQYRPDTNEFQGTLDSTSGDLTDTGNLPYTDEPHFLVIDWFVNGSDVWQCDVYLDNSVILSDTASFRPFVHVTQFDIETEPYSPVTIGHITMETGVLFTRTLSFRTEILEAGRGFPGETAVERFVRLCETEGVAYEVFEHPDIDVNFPTLMGPQRPGNFIDHLDDISFADGGVIYELRTPFGYGFRTRASQYAEAPALTLDYTNTDLGEVPTVTDDDANLRNIIRAKLRGGTQGEMSYVVTDGPLGTAARREYEDGGLEVALNDTDQLADWVAWAAFLGTWDEDRWPELTLHLHRAPFTNDLTKFVHALFLEIGQLLQIQNPPAWVGNGTDAIVQQMRAVAIHLSNFTITLAYTLLPGGPYYTLGELNNTDADRADIEDCYLVSSVDSDDTTLITTTNLTHVPMDTPLWTRDPAEFNSWGHQGMALRLTAATRSGGLGGERVTLGVPAPIRDTFTRSASQLAGSNADTGETWAQTAGTATNTTVNGSAAVALHSSANTTEWVSLPVGDWDHSLYVTVTYNFTTCTGGQYITDYVVRQTDANNAYFVRLVMSAGSASVVMQLRKVSGGTGSQIGSDVTIGNNVSGTPIHVRLSIVGRDFMGKAWLDGTEEPEWLVTGLDAALEPINGTSIGLRSNRATGNTNANATSTWDNLEVQTPLIRPVVWDRFAYTALDDPSAAFPDDPTYGFSWAWFTAGLVQADLDFTPNQFQVTGSDTLSYGAIYLDQIDYLDGVCSVVWTCPVVTGTGGLEPGNIMMRGTSITDYILFRALVTADNQIFGQIYDRDDNLLGQCYVPPDAHRADRPMKTKAGCFGSQLMIKIWDPTKPEPHEWGLVVTDPNPVPGWVGLRAGRGGGNTNANAAMTFHEFRMENPQRLTVVRSANGITRGWEAGSAVNLWSPLRLGR